MRQSRWRTDEIIRIIAESELPTASMAGTARKYGVQEATLSRRRAQDKGLSTQESKGKRDKIPGVCIFVDGPTHIQPHHVWSMLAHPLPIEICYSCALRGAPCLNNLENMHVICT